MDTRTKIVLLAFLLSPVVLMEEVDPVISELRVRPRQEIKVLEESIKEVQEVIKKQGEMMKEQEEKMKEQEEKMKEQEEKMKELEEKMKEQEEKMKEQEEKMKEQEEKMKEQEEKMKEQEEKIKELEDCKACSKIEELNETLNDLQEKVDSAIDIDECASGVHECHRSASCINTVGSYTCSCNQPYTGDGKTCTLPAECQNYQSLTSADRKTTYGTNSVKCDNHLGPGWFRFQGAAGTRMPTSCPPKNRCNANIPGWLNGEHPSVAEGQVTRQVCFHWGSGCCYWSKSIQVRNCGSFYVYYFNGTGCYARYCGTD